MNNYPLYKRFAMTLNAYQNCIKTSNKEWEDKHYGTLIGLLNELPRGSGIDGQCLMDLEKSTPNKLIIQTAYHYMNDAGYYDGWYSYKVVVTPSLQNGVDVTIIGKNTPNDAKDYIWQVFYEALTWSQTDE